MQEAKIDGKYDVAKEKCDSMKGNEKDACEKTAKAERDRAKADMKRAEAKSKRAQADGGLGRHAQRQAQRQAGEVALRSHGAGTVERRDQLRAGQRAGRAVFGREALQRARPHHARQARSRAGRLQALQQGDRQGSAPGTTSSRATSTSDGRYVVLSDEDFRRANVEASKTVEIHGFVELGEIPPQYFETPYYLSPGKRGEKAYALLRDAL